MITNSKIKNDDDYRKVVKLRIKYAVVLIILGIGSFLITLFSEPLFGLSADSHQISFYNGIGVGLIFGGIVLLIKFGRLLKNEQRLRESRIKNTDERVQSISSKALVSAGLILFAAIYIMGLIGGIFYPILIKVMAILVAIFLVSYFVLFRIFAARS